MCREERLCKICDLNEVEDEEHSSLRCKKFDSIRNKHGQLFPCASLKRFFENEQSMVAKFIEDCYECLGTEEVQGQR